MNNQNMEIVQKIIKKAKQKLAEFLSPFNSIDTSKLAELEESRRQCEISAANLEHQFYTTNTNEEGEEEKIFNSNIYENYKGIKQNLNWINREIEKIEKLAQIDNEICSMIENTMSNINSSLFNQINSLNPTNITEFIIPENTVKM